MKAPERKRALRPRAPVNAITAMYSQLNCEPGLGVDARRFLERVVPLCEGHVVSVGKLRLVPVAVVLERLAATATDGNSHDEKAERDSSESPQLLSEDDILARLGRRRVGGGR